MFRLGRSKCNIVLLKKWSRICWPRLLQPIKMPVWLFGSIVYVLLVSSMSSSTQATIRYKLLGSDVHFNERFLSDGECRNYSSYSCTVIGIIMFGYACIGLLRMHDSSRLYRLRYTICSRVYVRRDTWLNHEYLKFTNGQIDDATCISDLLSSLVLSFIIINHIFNFFPTLMWFHSYLLPVLAHTSPVIPNAGPVMLSNNPVQTNYVSYRLILYRYQLKFLYLT